MTKTKKNVVYLHRSRPDQTLTPTEFEVVTLLAVDGARTCDIADIMGLSSNTVKRHLWHAMDKIGVENRTALALWYVRMYPTEVSRENGYAHCWIYLAERLYGTRAKRHNVLPISDEKILLMLTGGKDDIEVPKGSIQ